MHGETIKVKKNKSHKYVVKRVSGIYRLTLANPLQNGLFYFSVTQQPLAAMASSLSRLQDHIKTHHTR